MANAKLAKSLAKTKNKNKGFGFIDFFLTLLLVIFMIVPVGLTIPTVIEYFTLKKTVDRIKATSTDTKEAKTLLNNQFVIDNIRFISANDIQITEENDKVNLAFDYKQPIPLYGMVSLLMHYKYSTQQQ